MGCWPDHSPRFACRVLPTAAVPVIDGSVLLVGPAELITAVGFDVAVS